MDQQKYADLKLGERAALISIIAYIILSITKLTIGFRADSEALRADGLNNTTDIAASIAVLIGLKLSQKPADKDHPYGHWKAESIASLIASFIMMAVGLQVLYGSFLSVIEGKQHAPDMTAAWTGILSATAMYFVYRYNKQIANKINSHAVMAAAKDNLSDAWVSIGTAIGIIGAQFNLAWLDPLAAAIVGLLICKTAWDIFRESSHYLTDGYDEKKLSNYQGAVMEVPGVKGVKDIRARAYGNNTVVDIVILVSSTLDIKDAHDISSKVEDHLKETHQIYDVHVHVEPN
ncbi:cation diffusion facilitator family transporter [Bacillus sp. P14.5]|uniref:cation diffusion facilitator family transporter n=1 Tax=Bacillus sp. P14.5 TaxID=1983400 RepID=UPI000DE91C72|nr:cation diffusion facilitator family transporter [Bacillus sp. P14.5]